MTAVDVNSVEADLDVLDENGTVLLTVSGLRLGNAASETADRVLGERLLTIEWQQRTLPEASRNRARDMAIDQRVNRRDVLAAELTDALKLVGAPPTTLSWPQDADHDTKAEQLGSHLSDREFKGVVVLVGPENRTRDDAIRFSGPRVRGTYGTHSARAAGHPGRATAVLRRYPRGPDGGSRRPTQS